MGRPRLHDEQLRQRLLDAATEVLAEQGVDFSLRPLVAAVGTSTSAVYSLFGSRGSLVDAITLRAAESLIEAQCAVHAPSASSRVLALARNFRHWANAHTSEFQVVFAGPSGSPAIRRARNEAARPLFDAVEGAIDEGALVGDPSVTTRAILAGLHGFISLERVGVLPPDGADVLFEAHLSAIWRGWSNENTGATEALAA